MVRPTHEPLHNPQKPKEQIAAVPVTSEIAARNTPFLGSNEDFYVLENGLQQLVFSTRGGALAEINLPLKSDLHPNSIVKEIDFDRQIIAGSPQNARFPLKPYRIITENGTQTREEGTLGNYYPLLRRPILDANNVQKKPFPAEYYAFNVVGDDPSIANTVYQVTRFEKNLIQFTGKTAQGKITKTFFIPEERNGPYCLQLDVKIEGSGQNLWITSGIPDVELVGGSYSPLLRYQVPAKAGNDVETIDLPRKEIIQGTEITPNWISNCNGFFGIITDPLMGLNVGFKAEQIDGALVPTRLSLIDPKYSLYPASSYPAYATALPLQAGSFSFRIFAGPFDENLLKSSMRSMTIL